MTQKPEEELQNAKATKTAAALFRNRAGYNRAKGRIAKLERVVR